MNGNQSVRIISISPTQNSINLNQNSSHFLPDVEGAQRLPFGIGQKADYQAFQDARLFENNVIPAPKHRDVGVNIEMPQQSSASRQELTTFMPMIASKKGRDRTMAANQMKVLRESISSVATISKMLP